MSLHHRAGLMLALLGSAAAPVRAQRQPTDCTSSPLAVPACGLQAISLPPLEAVRLREGERELRFWWFSAWGVPIHLITVRQHGDSVTGRALIIWKAQFAEEAYALGSCGERWIGRGVVTCEARHAVNVDWRALLRTLDSAGVNQIPATPVPRMPCTHPDTTLWTEGGLPRDYLCPMVGDADSRSIEYRTPELYWNYHFDPLPDTTARGLARDEAILRALQCVQHRMQGGGCRPAMASRIPWYRWTARPRDHDWRPTTGLLTFATDSLVRLILPDGYREWRIQLDCTGCSPGYLLRILETPDGGVFGASYLFTSDARVSAVDGARRLEHDHWVDAERTTHACGPAVRLDGLSGEACEINLTIDYREVLGRLRASGIPSDLHSPGRTGAAAGRSASRVRIERNALGALRLVVDPPSGECSGSDDQELVVEMIADSSYRSGSFWCLERATRADSSPAPLYEFRAWLNDLVGWRPHEEAWRTPVPLRSP